MLPCKNSCVPAHPTITRSLWLVDSRPSSLFGDNEPSGVAAQLRTYVFPQRSRYAVLRALACKH